MVDIFVSNSTNNKKKKVKRLSSTTNVHYYPTAFITKPCDQLFGPQPLDCSIDKKSRDKSFNSLFSDSSNNNTDDLNVSTASSSHNTSTIMTTNEFNNENLKNSDSNYIKINSKTDSTSNISNTSLTENSKFEYIPAPKWNKVQNSMLEEMFKKSRYPKPSELKSFAQRLHVMDSDIEEWFRKRRGRDRKTRRKNEALKNLIDNYLDK